MKEKGRKYDFGMVCVLLVEIAIIVCAVLAFIKRFWALGAVACVAFLLVLWFLAGFLRLRTLLTSFEASIKNRKLDEAEKAAYAIRGNMLFNPIMHYSSLRVMLVLSMAKDNLGEAKNYIERMRHEGGVGGKYETAYYTVLIALDEGNVQLAREEYEDFRRNNQGFELYREQLEVLDALFARLFTRSDKPLPASVSASFFPVVSRILGKHFEERAAESTAEWN